MFRIYEAVIFFDRLPGVSHRVTLCSNSVAEGDYSKASGDMLNRDAGCNPAYTSYRL
jgi:hypothetical protein